MRNLLLWISALAAAGFWSCDLAQKPVEERHYVSLRVDSTLTRHDRVTVTLVSPGGDTMEVWDGALPDVGRLSKVEVKGYDGGPVDVLITAIDGNKIVYSLIIHYTGPATKPEVDTPPLPDYVPPVITMAGADSLDLVKGRAFQDTVTCEDDRDPHPKLQISGGVPADSIGIFVVDYACKDSSGNQAVPKKRTVRVVEPPTLDTLMAKKESEVDTSDLARNPNLGYTPMLLFGRDDGDTWMSFVKFDLAEVVKSGLNTAEIRFNAFYTNLGSSGAAKRTLTFNIYAIKSDWIEGTGNWYFHRGAFQNDGENYLTNYGITLEDSAHSTDPVQFSGVAPSDKAIFRKSNLVLLKSVTRVLDFAHCWTHSDPIPPREDLRTLALDVTEYVKAADPAKDYGFMITVTNGLGDVETLDFFTKEAGDGTLGPRLILGY